MGIGPSADLGLRAKSESSDVLKIKTLETREFDAREDYIRRVLALKPVGGYIGEFGARTTGRTKPVELYMISGLKIAKEALSFTSTDLREAGGSAGGVAGAAAKAKLTEIALVTPKVLTNISKKPARTIHAVEPHRASETVEKILIMTHCTVR